jgi:hypothetical protein
MALLVLVAAAVVITIAGFHAFLAQNQLRLERLRAQTSVAEARYDAERLENGQLASPERITWRAEALGLLVPDVAPVAVPLTGEVPRRGDRSSTIDGWTEVKGNRRTTP